jgi:vancomycin resistance protein VanJ
MSVESSGRIWSRLAWMACAALVGLTALMWIGGDVWWPVFPFLFGPRVAAGILLLPTLPLLLTRPTRGLVPFVLALGLFFFGILGLRVGPARIIPGPLGDLRVLAYNVDNKQAVVARVLARLDSLAVDVAVLVECPDQSSTAGIPARWLVEAHGGLCLFSRYPVLAWEAPSHAGVHSFAKAELSIGSRVVRLGMVHLATPHATLLEFRAESRIPGLGPRVRENLRDRDADSQRAGQFFAADETTPVIIAGDFNLPIESRVFQRYWSGYSDSFEHAGIGLGTTFRYGLYMIRIDHIISRGGVTAVQSWVGPDLGSDHLPVIADLALPKR